MITTKKGDSVKRVAILLLLPCAAAFAEAQLYFGADCAGASEYFTVTNPGTDPEEEKALFNSAQIKAGYGDIKGYALELDFGYGRYDKNIFSPKDTDYYYFDLSLIKAFDFHIGVFPFFKVGFGTGELEVDRTLVNSISSGSFYGGIGTYIPIAFGFDFEASVIYRDKSWEDLQMVGAQVESGSYIVEPYLGIDYRF